MTEHRFLRFFILTAHHKKLFQGEKKTLRMIYRTCKILFLSPQKLEPLSQLALDTSTRISGRPEYAAGPAGQSVHPRTALTFWGHKLLGN